MAQKTSGRIVRHLSTAYFVPFNAPDGTKASLVRTARRGDEVDPSTLAEGEEERLDGLKAFLPKGSGSQDLQAEGDAILDLYRGQRGDTEALQRAYARAGQEVTVSSDTSGGIEDVTLPDSQSAPLAGPSVLADQITNEKLSIDDTVALAGNDPVRARRVIEAENLASGHKPRKGVEDKLNKIIDG